MKIKKGETRNPKGHPETLIPGPKPKRVLEPLASMRWVTEHDAGEDVTEWQRKCRLWMNDDAAGFAEALARREASMGEKRVKESSGPAAAEVVAAGPAVLADAGTDRCEQLCREVLVRAAEGAKGDLS